jgi:hypothetical protein
MNNVSATEESIRKDRGRLQSLKNKLEQKEKVEYLKAKILIYRELF